MYFEYSKSVFSDAQQTANYLRAEIMRGALINTMPVVHTLMTELGVSRKDGEGSSAESVSSR